MSQEQFCAYPPRRSALPDNAPFMERHITDSTGSLELITLIEEMLHITVEQDELLPENLDAIHAYLSRRKLATAAS